MKKFYALFGLLVMAFAGILFTSCDDSDNENTVNLQLGQAIVQYVTMTNQSNFTDDELTELAVPVNKIATNVENTAWSSSTELCTYIDTTLKSSMSSLSSDLKTKLVENAVVITIESAYRDKTTGKVIYDEFSYDCTANLGDEVAGYDD